MGFYKSTVVSGADRSLWASLTGRPVPSLLSRPQQKAKNEELIQLAEQRKREAERKKKEVEEKESATLRRQHERERRARVEEVGLLFTLDHNSDPTRCQLTSMLADFVLYSHKVSALHPSSVEFEFSLRGSFSQQAACVSAGPQGALASHPHPAEEARAAAAQPQASHRRRPAVSSTAVCEADTHTPDQPALNSPTRIQR